MKKPQAFSFVDTPPSQTCAVNIFRFTLHMTDNFQWCSKGFLFFIYTLTYTFLDENKCPSYKGTCLIEVIFNKFPPLNHWKVSVIECSSCMMWTLKSFTAQVCDERLSTKEKAWSFSILWHETLIRILVKRGKSRGCRQEKRND